MNQTNATLIGVPLDLGAKNLGVAEGPAAFRRQEIVRKLEFAGLNIQDNGDIAVAERETLSIENPRLKYLGEIVRVNELLAQQTEDALRAGQKVVVIGGDHSINLGTIAGASAAVNGQLGQIYLDAHGDMNTDQTTPSGNIHGMNLAAGMGFGADALTNLYRPGIKLPKENLLHIAGCDWDQAELDLISREGLTAFTLFDIVTKGIGQLLSLVDALAERAPNAWISLDLDCIDKVYAPGAGMPNARGLSYREIVTIADYIATRCNVIGIDVVEFNPRQDVDSKTAELGIELIARFLGHEYSWYANYLADNQL
jgi:arginase